MATRAGTHRTTVRLSSGFGTACCTTETDIDGSPRRQAPRREAGCRRRPASSTRTRLSSARMPRCFRIYTVAPETVMNGNTKAELTESGRRLLKKSLISLIPYPSVDRKPRSSSKLFRFLSRSRPVSSSREHPRDRVDRRVRRPLGSRVGLPAGGFAELRSVDHGVVELLSCTWRGVIRRRTILQRPDVHLAIPSGWSRQLDVRVGLVISHHRTFRAGVPFNLTEVSESRVVPL